MENACSRLCICDTAAGGFCAQGGSSPSNELVDRAAAVEQVKQLSPAQRQQKHQVGIKLVLQVHSTFTASSTRPVCRDTIMLPAFRSQQAFTSHKRHAHCLKAPFDNSKAPRRQLVIAAGEARSANRTKWTQKDLQTQQQTVSSHKHEQYVSSISQLSQADKAHELVSERLAAAVAADQQQSKREFSHEAGSSRYQMHRKLSTMS